MSKLPGRKRTAMRLWQRSQGTTVGLRSFRHSSFSSACRPYPSIPSIPSIPISLSIFEPPHDTAPRRRRWTGGVRLGCSATRLGCQPDSPFHCFWAAAASLQLIGSQASAGYSTRYLGRFDNARKKEEARWCRVPGNSAAAPLRRRNPCRGTPPLASVLPCFLRPVPLFPKPIPPMLGKERQS